MTWRQCSWPLVVCLCFCSFFSGCSPQPASPLPVSPVNLVPYLTQTPKIIPTVTLPATEIPSPTSTPQIYSIASGDTLSQISKRFGVSLESLQAANPGLQPAALTVGQTLIIPSAAGPNPYLPTPLALELGRVNCFPISDGLTCLAPVHNPNPETVENVQVQISLLDENGQTLQSQLALLPLNILPPGQSLPASTHFQKTSNSPAVAQLNASIPLNTGDPRYLQTRLDNLLIRLGWNGRFAQIEGQVILAENLPPAKLLWLAATAYEAGGEMIGFRRWEWTGILQSGQAQQFSFIVYSLGPEIDRVEVQVEARP